VTVRGHNIVANARHR